MNLAELKQAAFKGPVETNLDCQIVSRRDDETQGGNPFVELELADVSGTEKLKFWKDSAAFTLIKKQDFKGGEFIRISSVFTANKWGINMKLPLVTMLEPLEKAELLAGGEVLREQNFTEWTALNKIVESIEPKLLSKFVKHALAKVEPSFRRAAAAKSNHHNRRGGLLSHTLSMLRVAHSMVRCYPEACEGLLIAGIVFHDLGKIYENDYDPQGFSQQITMTGALKSHIPSAHEMLIAFWSDFFKGENFTSLRDQLVHLILCHHGQKDYGSPVEYATPEGVIIHFIDMMDARFEMLRTSYKNKEVTLGVHESVRNFGSQYVVKPWKESDQAAQLRFASMMEATYGEDPDDAADTREILENAGIFLPDLAITAEMMREMDRRSIEVNTLIPGLRWVNL